MTTVLRKVLLLLAAVLTLVVLATGTAQATFTAKATTLFGVTTTTVAAPAGVSTAGTYCSSTSTYYNGTWYSRSTMHAKVSWTASATRGVSGYRVTAWLPDGSTYPVGDVGAGTTSVAMDVDGSYASQNIRVTVTTLTSYGWSKQSTRSGAISC